MLNIGGPPNDASWRYKMPKMLTKIESSGNGVKTVVVNLVAIADALECDPLVPLKYFSYELGAISNFDMEVGAGHATLNGTHPADHLQKLLEKFIQIFILCPKCKLPEMELMCERSDLDLTVNCVACHYHAPLKTPHKLATYISKNFNILKHKKKAVKAAAAAVEGAEKNDSKDKKARKGKKVKSDEKKEKTKTKSAKDEKDEWFSDTSEEAQRERLEAELAEMKHVDKAVAHLSIKGKGPSSESAKSVLSKFLTSGPNQPSMDEIWCEVKRLQLSRSFDDKTRAELVLDVIIPLLVTSRQPLDISTQIAKHAKLFLKLAPFGDIPAQQLLLGALEAHLSKAEPTTQKLTPFLLQGFYEHEVLSEESLLSWAESSGATIATWNISSDGAKKVRAYSKPFVEWLQTAEEDDEEDGN